MDFIEQEAECSDLSDGYRADEQDNADLERFIDDQEYEDEVPPFTNVERPIDGDAQPRLYDRESVDGNSISISIKISSKLKSLGRPSSVFQKARNLTYFFRRQYMVYFI